MSTTTGICICQSNHKVPLDDNEIFRILHYMWTAEQIDDDMSFEEVRDVSDFTETHLSPALWEQFAVRLCETKCLYGHRHTYSDCTTDCFEA